MIRLQVSSSGIGPRIFTKRLVKFMQQKYDVILSDKKPHIYMSSVWRGKPPTGAITIHRLDGVYFNKDIKNAKAMNSKISVAVKKAHGIIYQSEHSRKMCKGILGLSKKGVIIHNGFSSSLYEDISVNKMGYKKMLVACAKWRSLKRPKSIAKGFRAANLEDTVLVMIGDINKRDKLKHPNIIYTGSITTSETYKYYVSCDGVIHISRSDACPNTVVEALMAGKPVLCNNVGGTPEIVKDSGVIIDIDPPFPYRMFSMGNPDKIDSQVIANGVKGLLSRDWEIQRPDLSMETCADKYYQYFMKKLNP